MVTLTDTTDIRAAAIATDTTAPLTRGARHIRVVHGYELAQTMAAHSDVLAWFTTSWCGPCKVMAPHIDQFAKAHPDRITVVAVDGDADRDLLCPYRTETFPTLMLLRRGVPVAYNPPVGPQSNQPDSLLDLDETFLPLLDAAAERITKRHHRSPSARPRRPAGTVTLPATSDESLLARVIRLPCDGYTHPTDATRQRFPSGSEISVVLSSNWRTDPPMDPTASDRFEPHSVGSLEIHGAPVASEDQELRSTTDDISSAGQLRTVRHILPDAVVNNCWSGLPASKSAEHHDCDQDGA